MNQSIPTTLACSVVMAFCIGSRASAQIAVTYTAPLPLSVSAKTPTGVQSITQPAGALGPAVWLNAFQYPAIAEFSQVLTVADAEVTLDCVIHAQVDDYFGPAVGSASCGPNVTDLRLSVAQPTQVELTVEFLNLSDPGAPTPGFTIDIGNDGLVENTNGQWSSPSASLLVLDGQPKTIRVTSWADVAASGTARARAVLRVKPSHTDVSPALVAGCGVLMEVLPTFPSTGIDVYAGDSASPTFLVFGFAPQPILLPPSPGQPCLLYPQVDVLVPMPASGPLSVPLPATLRPFQVWLQAVGVTPLGLKSSSAHLLAGW